MTLEELCAWHAIRAGWKFNVWVEGDAQWENRFTKKAQYEDPFPATLDGADASMPPGYQWIRVCRAGGTYEWIAQKYHGIRSAACDDTGNKVHDLYALSKLAWEQEAA